MAITCSSFSTTSLASTSCVIAQKTEPANIGNNEIDPLKFLYLVADMIEQLRANPGTIPTLASINMCDATETLRQANCATQFFTFPAKTTPAQLQAIILNMLNEALCT